MCLCDSQGGADLTSYVFKPAEALSTSASRCSTRQKCGTPLRGAQWSTACRPRADQVVHGARRCLPGAQQHVHTAAIPAHVRRLVHCAHRPPPSQCTKQQEQQQQPAQRQEAAAVTMMERHASQTYFILMSLQHQLAVAPPVAPPAAPPESGTTSGTSSFRQRQQRL